MALREIFARFRTQFDGRQLDRGERQTRSLTSRLDGVVGTLGRVGTAFAALAIVGIIRSWISAANSFVDTIRDIGDELDKTSKVVGISTAALQEWRHAANLSGVDASSFTQGLIRIQNNMRNALITPTSSASLAFRRLGVSIRDSNGELRNVSDVLTDMADPLQDLASDSERVAILTALAGRSGARMGPLFAQGREGVEAMRAELAELGGGVSPEAIQASADLTDAYARFDLAVLSIKSRLSLFLLPAFQAITEAMTAMASTISQSTALAPLLEAALWTIVTVLGVIAIITLPTWLPMLLTIGAIVVAVGLLIFVVQDFLTWLRGGESIIGLFAAALLERTGLSLHRVGEQIRGLMDDYIEFYNMIARSVGLGEISTSSAAPTATVAPTSQQAAEDGDIFGGFVRNLRVAGAGARARDQELAGATGLGAFAQGFGQAALQQVNNVTINGATDPDAVRRVVDQSMNRANREAREALTQ